MKRLTLLLLTGLAFPLSVLSGEVILSIASFEPPAFLGGNKPRNDPGDDPFSGAHPVIQYYAQDNHGSGSRYRELEIGRRAVGFTIDQGRRVTWQPVKDDDIKKLMAEVCTMRATNSPKVEQVEFAGHKAFKVRCVVPMPQIHEGIVFQFDYVWIPVHPNELVTLKLVGSDELLLKTVQDSLSTFKILPDAKKHAGPQAPELIIAKDAVRLGDERSQVVKACGKAVHQGSYSDLFFTDKYFISVGYDMPRATYVTYMHVSDAKKYLKAAAEYTPDAGALHQPLEKADFQELLARHCTGGDGVKLTWKITEENRWERSDGAKAGYHPASKIFVVATKEVWPKLGSFRK